MIDKSFIINTAIVYPIKEKNCPSWFQGDFNLVPHAAMGRLRSQWCSYHGNKCRCHDRQWHNIIVAEIIYSLPSLYSDFIHLLTQLSVLILVKIVMLSLKYSHTYRNTRSHTLLILTLLTYSILSLYIILHHNTLISHYI